VAKFQSGEGERKIKISQKKNQPAYDVRTTLL